MVGTRVIDGKNILLDVSGTYYRSRLPPTAMTALKTGNASSVTPSLNYRKSKSATCKGDADRSIALPAFAALFIRNRCTQTMLPHELKNGQLRIAALVLQSYLIAIVICRK